MVISSGSASSAVIGVGSIVTVRDGARVGSGGVARVKAINDDGTYAVRRFVVDPL